MKETDRVKASDFSLALRCESSMKNSRVLMASWWRLVAVLGLLIAPGAPRAFAAGPIPAADGVIHGCYNNATGVLRVVSDASQCLSSTNALVQRNAALLETPLAWNQAGPQGPKGDTGATGAQGPAGPAGVSGLEIVATGGAGETVVMCPAGKYAISGGARATELFAMQAGLIEGGPYLGTTGLPQGWVGKASVQQEMGFVVTTGQFFETGQSFNLVFDSGVAVWATCVNQPPTVTNIAAVGGVASLDLNVLTFDSDVTNTQTVTLTNTGQTPLENITLRLSGSSRYSVTSACPPPPFGVPVGTPIPYGPLAPGSSCTIDVTYTATTGTAPTRVLGSLAIASNAINGVVNVAILATGDPATCQGRPSCLQP